MAYTLPCRRFPAVCCGSYQGGITSFFIGYGICRAGRASGGRALGDAAKRLPHLLPLRGRTHSHQLERPRRAGTARRSRSPLPAGPTYARHLRTYKADPRLYLPVPDLHPFRCPRTRPPLRRAFHAPLLGQKLRPRAANGFPHVPPNAASAEPRRSGGVWAARQNRFPHPFRARASAGPPTAIRHPADAAFRAVRPACPRKPR